MLLGERSEEVTPPVPPQPQNHHHHQLQQLQMQQQQLQMQQQQFPMQQHQLQMQQQHQQLPMQQHQLQMQQQHQQLPMQQQQQQLQMQQQLQQLPMQHQHQQLQMQQQYQLHQMQEQQQQQPKRPVVHQRDSRRGSAFSPTDEVAVLENLLQTRETYEDFNRGATSSCNGTSIFMHFIRKRLICLRNEAPHSMYVQNPKFLDTPDRNNIKGVMTNGFNRYGARQQNHMHLLISRLRRLHRAHDGEHAAHDPETVRPHVSRGLHQEVASPEVRLSQLPTVHRA